MCGIVAIVGNLAVKDNKIFDELMDVNVLRGRDSAGAFSVPISSNAAKWYKCAGHVSHLKATKAYGEVRRAFSSRAMVGHCRATTVGASTTPNAHPFGYKNIVGVHNGTLHGWKNDLATFMSEQAMKDHEVDSAALYDAIDGWGADLFIPEVSGAWAMIWYNWNTDRLHILRNEKRPLWYAENKARDCVYYASEMEMLQLVLERNDVSLHTDKEGYSYFEVDADVLHTLQLRGTKPHVTLEAEEPLEGYTPPVRKTETKAYQGFPMKKDPLNWKENMKKEKGDGEQEKKASPASTAGESSSTNNSGTQPNSSTTSSSKTSPTPTSSKSCQTKNNEELGDNSTNSTKNSTDSQGRNSRKILSLPNYGAVDDDSDGDSDGFLDDDLPWSVADSTVVHLGGVRGPDGKFLSEEQFNKKTKEGCAFCQQDYSYDEAKRGALAKDPWLPEGGFLCHRCDNDIPIIGQVSNKAL